jgi:hypothetical protein
MDDRSDDLASGATPRVPKYRAPDFMAKQIALWGRARALTYAARRYGDSDAPLPAVTPVGSIRSVRPVRIGRI